MGRAQRYPSHRLDGYRRSAPRPILRLIAGSVEWARNIVLAATTCRANRGDPAPHGQPPLPFTGEGRGEGRSLPAASAEYVPAPPPSPAERRMGRAQRYPSHRLDGYRRSAPRPILRLIAGSVEWARNIVLAATTCRANRGDPAPHGQPPLPFTGEGRGEGRSLPAASAEYVPAPPPSPAERRMGRAQRYPSHRFDGYPRCAPRPILRLIAGRSWGGA